MNQQRSLHVSQQHDLPHLGFLQFHNFLGEFKTEVDKARVRYNLGIPDEYSFNWGNITGVLEKQTDLMNYLNLFRQNLQKSVQAQATNIDSINQLLTTHSNSISNLDSNLTALEQVINPLETVPTDILELKREVSQNATAIAQILDGGEISTIRDAISTIRNQLNTLENRTTSNEATVTSINSKLNTLENNLNTLQLVINNLSSLSGEINNIKESLSEVNRKIEAINSQLKVNTLTLQLSTSTINVQDNAGEVPITITAKYSVTGNVVISDYSQIKTSSTNPSVAIFSNGNVRILSAGTSTIRFTYTDDDANTATAELSVTVTAQVTPTTTVQYVGFGTDYTQIFEKSAAEVSTVKRNFTSVNVHNFDETASRIWFYFITTETISSVIPTIGQYKVEDLYDREITSSNGTKYKVYIVGPTTLESFNLTIN